METVGCDRSETDSEPRLPRSAHQTPASGLSCCSPPLQLMGLEPPPPITQPRQSLAGLISNVPEPVASFFLSSLQRHSLFCDQVGQRLALALALTTPTHTSIRHRRTAASRRLPSSRDPCSLLRSLLPCSLKNHPVAVNAWLALGVSSEGENTNQPINSGLWLPTV